MGLIIARVLGDRGDGYDHGIAGMGRFPLVTSVAIVVFSQTVAIGGGFPPILLHIYHAAVYHWQTGRSADM